MAESSSIGAGRFARDLQRIRQERGLTLDEVHQATKVPRGLLEEFEESALVGHPVFNRVYLRSLVRTYAQQLDLSPAFTLRALEKALDDNYEGELRDEYLAAEAEPEPAPTETEEPAEEDAPDAGRREKPVVEEEGPEQEQSPTARPEDAADPVRQESASPPEEEKEKAAAASAAGAGGTAERASASTSQRSRSRSGRSRRRRGQSSNRGLIYAGAVVVLIAAALTWFFFLTGDGEDEAAATGPVAADTSAQQQTATDESEPQAPSGEPVSIGDSLDFVVVAANGPVRELRVKRDDDLRRPYWIDEGESRTFSAQNRITFEPPIESPNERPLDMIELRLEGEPYPTDQRDAEGRIVVTREAAQAHLDSLARRPS